MSFILLLESLTHPLTQAVLTSSPSALNDWPARYRYRAVVSAIVNGDLPVDDYKFHPD